MPTDENMDILKWVILGCAYCKASMDAHAYHWQFYMGDGGILQAICPLCGKTNEVDIVFKKEVEK